MHGGHEVLVGDEVGLRDGERLAGRVSGRGCRGLDVDPGPDSLSLAADVGFTLEEGLLEPDLESLADPVGDGGLFRPSGRSAGRRLLR